MSGEDEAAGLPAKADGAGRELSVPPRRTPAASWLRRARRALSPAPLDPKRLRLEFLPDALEIEEDPTPVGAKRILVALLSLIFCAVVWASVATLDRIVVAQGKIVAASNKIVVQPLSTSSIRRIDVRIGQIVEKDQVLVSLDPTFAQADETASRAQTSSSKADVARMEAELAPLPHGAPPAFSDDPEEERSQRALYERHEAERAATAKSYDEEVRGLEAHLRSISAEKAAVATQSVIVERLLAMRKELHEHGTGSLVNLLDAENAVAANRRERAKLEADDTETRQKIETLRAKKAAAASESFSKTAQELEAARKDLAKSSQQTRKQVRLNELSELRAPMRAMVLEVAQRSAGSVAREGEALVTLVPLDVPVEIEASVDPKDIGRMRLGDSARIKLDAYPYQKHGVLEGEVASINGDLVEEELDGGRKAKTYRIRLRISSPNLREVPDGTLLMPGMAASCEVKIGTRRLISYFLYPLARTLDSALREP